MIYITTKNVKQIIRDCHEVRDDLIKDNKNLESELDKTIKSLEYWKNKAAKLESDLFDSSIINDLYDKGIKNRDGYYQITSYHPIGINNKAVAYAMSSMFGKGFNTSLIYTFDQLVKKIKNTDTDLSSYMIVEVSMK